MCHEHMHREFSEGAGSDAWVEMGHLQELEGVSGQAVLLQRLVEAVREALQVAQHAAKAAKGQRALARAGISNLQQSLTSCITSGEEWKLKSLHFHHALTNKWRRRFGTGRLRPACTALAIMAHCTACRTCTALGEKWHAWMMRSNCGCRGELL